MNTVSSKLIQLPAIQLAACAVLTGTTLCVYLNVLSRASPQVGIQVNCEDLFSDRHWRVCHAYATFVTQRTSTGQKVRGV